MVDEITPPSEPAGPKFTGPHCPEDQLPTTSHCPDYAVGCSWLVCENRHVIRTRDAHVMDTRGEYRPNRHPSAETDGSNDTRGRAHWNQFYPGNEQ